jgi:hypothetical protein
MKIFSTRMLQGMVLLSVLAALIGCNIFEQAQQANPTTPAQDAIAGAYGQEGGKAAPYVASNTPGVTVKADFTRYHLAGQPYGMWSVNATWRNQARAVIAEVTVPVTIDATTGQGAALLPPEFLNAVFQDAAGRYQTTGDTGTWHQRPGLYLNFFPADGDAWQYYAFE